MSAHSNEVKVYVRIRPTAFFAQDLIEYLEDKQTLNVHNRRSIKKPQVYNHPSFWSFRLDGVLNNASQEDVYRIVGHSMVMEALEGYNGTIMCFGQTGAGKTYTIAGTTESYNECGIIPRALHEVFCEVERRTDQVYYVHVSYLEIYNETLVDLLASGDRRRTLTVVDDPGGGVSVKGLSLHQVHSKTDALNLLFEGEMNRIIGEHALNKNSSRSHCIFTIHVESRSRIISNATYITSKLNMVDLAGSERLGKTGSDGHVQREAMYINKSLSFLEQVILALADRSREHVPFRQSKLTHALKDSLGGNCNTVLVANIYGEAAQIEETLSTLRFAARMKCLRTKPYINQRIDPIVQIQRLQKEIHHLKQELSLHHPMAGVTGVPCEDLSEIQIAEIKNQVQMYLAGKLDTIEILSMKQVQEVCAQFKNAVLEEVEKVKGQFVQENIQTPQSTPTNVFQMPGQVNGVVASSQKPLPSTKKFKKLKEGIKNVLEVVAAAPPPVAEAPPPTPESVVQETQQITKAPVEKQNITPPPPKTEAFEQFKAKYGSRINQVLKENKAVLLERQGQLGKLTDTINTIKQDIDSLSSKLKQCKEQRESQGLFVNVDGESVLSEAEVDLLLQLREAKDKYRQLFREVVNTKDEVNYCQQLVDKCRQRLLTEFENWYSETFLKPDEGSEEQKQNEGQRSEDPSPRAPVSTAS